MRKELKGLYLVIDPKEGFDGLQQKVEEVLRGGVRVVQVWDHWAEGQDRKDFLQRLSLITGDIPVIVNNCLELAGMHGVRGIHLDHIDDVDKVDDQDLIIGVTLSGPADWEELRDKGVDYISFCSMFPSSSTDACELVDFAVVKEACERFPGSVFASGGITLENADQILGLGVSGIAVISGLLKAKDPYQAATNFNKLIQVR